MPVAGVNCKGGLNTEAAIYDLGPGEAVALLNVEVDSSGTYTTMRGIEKFDGRAEPNKAVYSLINLDGVVGVVLGSIVTGSVSGATAQVIGIDQEKNKIGVIHITGVFALTDLISGNAIIALPYQSEIGSYAEHRQFRKYMQGIFRALIQPVPGVNAVRGIVFYKREIYSFRDHSDGTTCRMYKATTSGWTEIPTSGYLLKDGRYDFRVHNFQAGSSTQKLIIVNGKNKAVIYDGATCTQIGTGMPTDTPSSVEVLPSSILLLGYDNGSLMTSAPNNPNDFTVVNGGSEIGVSDKINGLALQPDERVAIFCEKSLRILSGKTTASFALSVFNPDAGAIKGSIANIGDSIFLSQNGITRLSRSQNYGAFEMAALDKNVKSIINKSDTLFSLAVRSKNQYRIFTSAGFVGLTLSGENVLGGFTGSYPVKMMCGHSADIDGEEYVLLGGEDGFVYRADVGQSHAGQTYSRVVRLAYNDLRSGQQRKKFKRLVVNADSDRAVPVKITVDLDYSSGDAPRQNPFVATIGGHEAYFGVAIFGKSAFGSANDGINQIHLSGVGRSLAVSLLQNSDDTDPVRFGGYSIEYEMRAKTR